MTNEIVLYKPNDQLSLEVKLENETVWLSLNQMAMLFGRDKSVISRHIKAVFQEGELAYEGSVAKNATVQMEGDRQVVRYVEYYNLNVIISVTLDIPSAAKTLNRAKTAILRGCFFCLSIMSKNDPKNAISLAYVEKNV